MILSGYLCIYRTSIKKTWASLIPAFVSFTIINSLHIVIQCFIWKASISLPYILKIFVGMDLAWYLEMYIGLVFLQPFLNTLWANLDRKKREVLVFTLVMLTMLGSISENLLPTYWVSLYPLTYYYIGAWLREYPLFCRWKPLFLGLVTILGLEAVRSFKDAGGSTFSWESFGGYACAYNALPVAICSIIFFLLVRKIPIHSKCWKAILQNTGRHTLSTYLVSVCVTDNIFWTILLPYFPTVQEFFPVQFPAAIVLYLLALLIANAVDGITHIICDNMQSFLVRIKSENNQL